MVQGIERACRKVLLGRATTKMRGISSAPKNQPFPLALQSVPWEGRRSVPLLGHGWEHEDSGVALSLVLGPNYPSTGVIAPVLFALAKVGCLERKTRRDFYGTTKAWFPLVLSHEEFSCFS